MMNKNDNDDSGIGEEGELMMDDVREDATEDEYDNFFHIDRK